MARKYWSHKVLERRASLDLEPGLFTKTSAKAIAESLKRSADRSKRRTGTSYQSAMSMLNFYINRGGKTLSKTLVARLERAKGELRKLYHRDAPARKAARKKTARKKTR